MELDGCPCGGSPCPCSGYPRGVWEAQILEGKRRTQKRGEVGRIKGQRMLRRHKYWKEKGEH